MTTAVHHSHAELKPRHPRRSAATTASLIPDSLPYPITTDIEQLLINDSKVADEIHSVITDGEIIETMDGAATLTLNMNDRGRALYRSGILDNWVNVSDPVLQTNVRGQKRHRVAPMTWDDVYAELDHRAFSLVQVNKSQDQFDIVFENRGVNEMRKYTDPKTWNRDTFTRAMVIKSMADEVVGFHIPVYAPELHKIQPITTKTKKLSTSEKKKLKQRGFAPNAHIQIKDSGDIASAQQKDWIGRVIATGESMNAPYKVLLAAIETITQESDVKMLNDPATGVGLFSQIPADGWPATGGNVEKDAHAFYAAAIPIYQRQPGIGTGALAQAVQKSGASPTGSLYQQWEKNAVNTLRAWGTGNGGSVSYQELQPYLFVRGKDGATEDSWDTALRLAKEVNWRVFMLDNALYYIDDETLINSMPYDTVSEKDDGIDSIDFEIDTGKTVSQCTVQAHVDRWQCPAGTVCIVDEPGSPVSGRWLVHEVRRPLFDTKAEITLQLPSPPKPEPAPSVKTVTLKGSKAAESGNKGIDKVYAKAKEISDKGYPYVYGGGHGSNFDPTRAGGGALGYDCSGYVSACLAAAGWISSPQATPELGSWGQPGKGKIMTVWVNPDPGTTGHTFIEFNIPKSRGRAAKHDQANTSHYGVRSGVGAALLPWGGNGAADAGSSAFHPRHWPGT